MEDHLRTRLSKRGVYSARDDLIEMAPLSSTLMQPRSKRIKLEPKQNREEQKLKLSIIPIRSRMGVATLSGTRSETKVCKRAP